MDLRGIAACLTTGLLLAGCAIGKKEEKPEKSGFFTSGNPQADQRAKAIQEASQTSEKKKSDSKDEISKAAAISAPENRTLYDRLGGEAGIRAIVDDFIKRAMEDPRVNWTREGVVQKSWFKRDKSVQWNPTEADIAQMKEHFVQFISLASGGPVQYKGQPIRSTHADLQITKPEFDAAMGDLKATLDKLNIDSEVQKELMSIFESTRPEIVPKSGSAF
jgi:hemoglobin